MAPSSKMPFHFQGWPERSDAARHETDVAGAGAASVLFQAKGASGLKRPKRSFCSR